MNTAAASANPTATAARNARVARHQHHDEHEDECDQGLDHERLARAHPSSDRGRGEHGLVARLIAEAEPDGEPSQHRAAELGAQIERHALPWELPRGRQSNRHRWIDMTASDVAQCRHHDEQRHAKGERHRQRVVGRARDRALERSGDGDGATYVDQHERPQQLAHPRAHWTPAHRARVEALVARHGAVAAHRSSTGNLGHVPACGPLIRPDPWWVEPGARPSLSGAPEPG